MQFGGGLDRHRVTVVIHRGNTELARTLGTRREEIAQPVARFLQRCVAGEDVAVSEFDDFVGS